MGMRVQLRCLFQARSLVRLRGLAAETQQPRFYSQPAPAPLDGSRPLGYPWRVVVSVCVQRLPSLSRETSDVERRYQDLKERLRVERSLLSDNELEEREISRLKRERERQALEGDMVEETAGQRAVEEFEELVEAREQELSAFQAATRTTEADRTGDQHSVDRQLDKCLYLLVRKERREHCWQMPQGALEEGESLLQAAKRGLVERCGSDMRVDFLSSTPSAYFSYHHSHPCPSGIIGSKVFFLKTQYRGGGVCVSREQGLLDYVWLTKKEMKDYVTDEYFRSLGSALIN